MKLKNKAVYIPLFVLGTSLLATMVSFLLIRNYGSQYTIANLESAVNDLDQRFDDRINLYKGSVFGAAGLFDASEDVTRQEWSTFVKSTRIIERFPGVLGLGYSQYILSGQKEVVEQRVRNEGFPDFKITPEGERLEYTSIVYIDPFDQRNQRAFGFDMFTDPERRTAMERARDTGDFAVSGKVGLLQQEGEDPQPAFIIYAPVYQKGTNPQTIEDRRKQLKGYIYSPVLMNDFIRGVSLETSKDLDFQVFDSTKDQLSEASLLFSTNPDLVRPGYAPEYSTSREIVWGGNVWTIRFITAPGFGLSPVQKNFPWVVLFLGLLLTAGLTALVRLAMAGSPQALEDALENLADTKKALAERELVIDSEPFGLIVCDHEGKIQVFNAEAERKLGYTETEAVANLNFLNLLNKNELAHRTAEMVIKSGIKTEPGLDTVVTPCLIDGQDKTVWTFITKQNQGLRLDVVIKPLYNKDNQLVGYQFII